MDNQFKVICAGIALVVVLIGTMVSSCTKYEEVDPKPIIKAQLHASEVVEVVPPEGPFHIDKSGPQKYYKAYVPQAKRIYYINVKASNYNLIGVVFGNTDKQTINVYTYYHKSLGLIWTKSGTSYHNRFQKVEK